MSRDYKSLFQELNSGSWSAREQLKFVVAFAERDLKGLKTTEWAQLSTDVGEFCRGQGLGDLFAAPRTPSSGRVPRKTIQRLQGEVRQVLRSAKQASDTVLAAAGDDPGLPNVPLLPIDVQVRYQLTLDSDIQDLAEQMGGRCYLTIVGELRDVFLVVLAHLLSNQSTESVRVCVCGRLFVCRGRQRVCTNADCRKQRLTEYNQKYFASPRGHAARKKQYEKNGWNFGARTKAQSAKASTH